MSETSDELILRYHQPAREWVEALPVDNGRLGAMVFGGIPTEHLQLNEDTLWAGGPEAWNNPRARKVLPEVRRLIAAGDYVGADKLYREVQGPCLKAYQPLGDLNRHFDPPHRPLITTASLTCTRRLPANDTAPATSPSSGRSSPARPSR